MPNMKFQYLSDGRILGKGLIQVNYAANAVNSTQDLAQE